MWAGSDTTYGGILGLCGQVVTYNIWWDIRIVWAGSDIQHMVGCDGGI